MAADSLTEIPTLISHWTRATLGRSITLKAGAPYRWDNPSRSWRLRAAGPQHSQELGQWVFTEGGSGSHIPVPNTAMPNPFSLQPLQLDFKLLQISAPDSLGPQYSDQCPLSSNSPSFPMTYLYLWFVTLAHVYLPHWVSLILHLRWCLLNNFPPRF